MDETGKGQRRGQIFTMYVPIFRDKLERLERRGESDSAEANALRNSLAQLDIRTSGAPQVERPRPYLAAVR
jgi:hypothetical protein